MQKSAEQKIDTRSELARSAGVSHDTIAKVEYLKDRVTPQEEQMIKTGQTTKSRFLKKKEARY